jgi:hypothetical membrane protein
MTFPGNLRSMTRPASDSAVPVLRPDRQALTDRPVPGWVLVSAALSPVLLTAGWLAAGALQPASYSPFRQTVSVLAGQAGTDRWMMTGALFLVGGCHLVTAAGLTRVRVSARILLIVAGLASIGIAVSPEPAHGSTPQHLAWTALGAVTIAVWPAFLARRTGSQPLILSVRGAVAATAVFMALLAWLIFATQSGAALGLAERLSSSVQTSWPFIVALVLWHTAPRNGRTGSAAPMSLPREHRLTCRAGSLLRKQWS